MIMGEWVSTEERLPAEGMSILFVVVDRLPYKSGEVFAGWSHEVGGVNYWRATFPRNTKFNHEEVILWQPFPNYTRSGQ